MAKLEVLKYPDPRLKLVAKDVTEFDSNLEKIANDMLETMYNNNGCGLAGIQVNIQKRIFTMDISYEANKPYVIINPKIIQQEGSQTNKEGCLSFPNLTIDVTRPQKLTIEYNNTKGELLTLEASNLMAQCIHHEMEHLAGHVFLDNLSKLKFQLALRKYKKVKDKKEA
tara:strand:- start:6139 stop:6645 length:507 start_codon:yes stop_codon:yes gene_type:complete